MKKNFIALIFVLLSFIIYAQEDTKKDALSKFSEYKKENYILKYPKTWKPKEEFRIVRIHEPNGNAYIELYREDGDNYIDFYDAVNKSTKEQKIFNQKPCEIAGLPALTIVDNFEDNNKNKLSRTTVYFAYKNVFHKLSIVSNDEKIVHSDLLYELEPVFKMFEFNDKE